MSPRARVVRSALAALVALGALAVPAWSLPNTVSPAPAPLFSISKSENRNIVQFVERLDASCAPLGEAPIYAFWRMLEHGPAATEPLLAREQPAYGIAAQSVTARGPSFGEVRVKLRALPQSVLVVESHRNAAGACEASARLPIDGVDARLANVHAVLRWPFGVSRLWVTGWSIADGRPVRDARSP
ncbi:MAG TPA: DUF4833 domain-containing protein [Polyangiaceae bacterium]